MGHGHVIANADGSKARCGGPAMCSVCQRELAALVTGKPIIEDPEQPWDARVEILKNALKAIKEMNPANRDLADAQVMARRALRDAKLEKANAA